MTLITGKFLDSGRVPIASGRLRVQLDAPLVDAASTPDGYALQIPRDFVITNGDLETCDLQESATSQTSYTFTLLQRFEDFDYFFAGTGEFYGSNTDRPVHLWTDSKYYSGVSHTPDSVALERVVRDRLDTVGSAFQAIVPNQPSVEFAQIARTGFATDRLPQNAQQVAQALLLNSSFVDTLINRLLIEPYSATRLYQRGNLVSLAGSAYQCLIDSTIAIAPNSGAVNWRVFVAKGDAGGTGGQDTPYSAATWDGAMFAPSANAIRDIVETLARSNNATLTGVSTAITAAQGTNTNQIATCAFTIAEIIARLTNVALPGTPTLVTTPLLTDNSQAIVNANFVKNTFHRYSRIIDSKSPGVSGGANVAGVNTRSLNTITTNAGDVVNLVGDTFTLRAGTYRIFASAPAHRVDTHRIFLWNVGSATRVLVGQNTQSANGDNTTNHAFLSGNFTIAANTDFQIRHFCLTAVATFGLGVGIGEAGVSETYTAIELWRLD